MPDAQRKADTVHGTLAVALVVSLACSSLVASAAVMLKPRQIANAVLDVRRNILEVAGLMDPSREVDELYERIEARVIDFDTGSYVEDVDPEAFDPLEAAKDPERSVLVPSDIDRARVGRRAKLGLVYLLRSEGEVTRIILPVSGYGLWSTMYGFLALEPDGNTIIDLTFYAHGETPGLGDFVSKPDWRERWRGKRAFDSDGNLRIEIVKGRVADEDPLAEHRVDGVSGATLTGNGVSNLLRYWLGDHGYGPYLRRVRRGDDA